MSTWEELEKLRKKIEGVSKYPVYHAASAPLNEKPFISLELTREEEFVKGLGYLHVDMWIVTDIHSYKDALDAGDDIISALMADQEYGFFHDGNYRSSTFDDETGVGITRYRLVIPKQRR